MSHLDHSLLTIGAHETLRWGRESAEDRALRLGHVMILDRFRLISGRPEMEARPALGSVRRNPTPSPLPPRRPERDLESSMIFSARPATSDADEDGASDIDNSLFFLERPQPRPTPAIVAPVVEPIVTSLARPVVTPVARPIVTSLARPIVTPAVQPAPRPCPVCRVDLVGRELGSCARCGVVLHRQCRAVGRCRACTATARRAPPASLDPGTVLGAIACVAVVVGLLSYGGIALAGLWPVMSGAALALSLAGLLASSRDRSCAGRLLSAAAFAFFHPPAFILSLALVLAGGLVTLGAFTPTSIAPRTAVRLGRGL